MLAGMNVTIPEFWEALPANMYVIDWTLRSLRAKSEDQEAIKHAKVVGKK